MNLSESYKNKLQELAGIEKYTYIPVDTNKYVYHISNPKFREEIAKSGLTPKGKSETWLSDTKIDGSVVFATNSDDKNEWFDSTYDDDIYQIDTTKTPNKWFQDPNFSPGEKYIEYNGKKIKLPSVEKENYHIITFDKIPVDAIELIYKGTGESKF